MTPPTRAPAFSTRRWSSFAGTGRRRPAWSTSPARSASAMPPSTGISPARMQLFDAVAGPLARGGVEAADRDRRASRQIGQGRAGEAAGGVADHADRDQAAQDHRRPGIVRDLSRGGGGGAQGRLRATSPICGTSSAASSPTAPPPATSRCPIRRPRRRPCSTPQCVSITLISCGNFRPIRRPSGR